LARLELQRKLTGSQSIILYRWLAAINIAVKRYLRTTVAIELKMGTQIVGGKMGYGAELQFGSEAEQRRSH